MAHEGLHPWLIYSLLEAMTQVHRNATLISDAGDYPAFVGSQIELDPRALLYREEGVPWIWRDLPPWVASFIDRYTMPLLAVVVFSGFVVTAGFLAELLGLLPPLLRRGPRRRRPD